jgi:UDP-3-O-[3-hydroxymyristoyl] glucosamine N-acyltransferase
MLLKHMLATLAKPNLSLLSNGAVVADTASIGQDVRIGPFVFIGHNSVIGDGTVIRAGAKIAEYVTVGKHCVISENTVIGNQGFGVERAPSGESFRIPHIGGVSIGDHVYIGALNTIVAGTIDPTVVEDHVQTDDHVHIAHNCYIRKGTHITACVEISGSVSIGENCTIGPNSSLMNKISIGSGSVVGLGAVVTKSFGDGVTIVGNPADTTDNIRALRRLQKELLGREGVISK